VSALPTSSSDADGQVVDLTLTALGEGPLWGMESAELNATLLAWPAGKGVAEHRNDELDVLVVVLAGSGALRLDGVDHDLSGGTLVLLPRGSVRSITAGPRGVRYVAIHRRRGPLLPRPRDADAEGRPCAVPSS
jgi:quercetin dioxygenase-like cupin family protein